MWSKLFEKALKKKKCFMVILLSLSGICLKLCKMDLTSTSLVLKKFVKGLVSYFVILFCQIILFTNIWCSFKPMCLILFNCGPSRVTENRTAVFILTSILAASLFTVRRD